MTAPNKQEGDPAKVPNLPDLPRAVASASGGTGTRGALGPCLQPSSAL